MPPGNSVWDQSLVPSTASFWLVQLCSSTAGGESHSWPSWLPTHLDILRNAAVAAVAAPGVTEKIFTSGARAAGVAARAAGERAALPAAAAVAGAGAAGVAAPEAGAAPDERAAAVARSTAACSSSIIELFQPISVSVRVRIAAEPARLPYDLCLPSGQQAGMSMVIKWRLFRASNFPSIQIKRWMSSPSVATSCDAAISPKHRLR